MLYGLGVKKIIHIKKTESQNGLALTAWCGKEIGFLDKTYMTIDNALKAVNERVGSYPCKHCLSEVLSAIKAALPINA